MELKKILCAVDLKDSVNPAVEYAKMLSELRGLRSRYLCRLVAFGL